MFPTIVYLHSHTTYILDPQPSRREDFRGRDAAIAETVTYPQGLLSHQLSAVQARYIDGSAGHVLKERQ